MAKPNSWIPVWFTLTFTQGQRVMSKLELVQSFCRKVASNSPNICDGWNNNDRIERRSSRLLNLLTVPRAVSNMYTQVARAQLSANHVQHVVCHMVWRDSSAIKFVRVEVAIILAFLLAETIKRWRRGGKQNLEKIQTPTKTRTCTLALVTG